MALLPTTNFARNGVPTHTGGAEPAGGGDQFTNTGNELLVIFNGGPALTPMSVTIATIAAVNGFKPPDKVITCPPGESIIFGPFPVEWYGPTPTINYSSTAGVLMHVIRCTELTKV